MEFVKIEGIKEEVSSGIERVEQMTIQYDIPIDQVVIESIECEKIDKEENNTPHCTETNITENEDDIEEQEFSYEQLKSIKIAHHMPRNEYLEHKAIECCDLNKLDVDPEQYINVIETIKYEQNVEKEDTDVIEIPTERQNKDQQDKRICREECKTGYFGKFKLKRIDKDRPARHRTYKKKKSVPSACTENDKRKQHSTRKNRENGALYQCSNCKYKTKVKKNLVQHWRARHETKIKWHHYNLCDFEAKYNYSSKDTSQKKT